MHDAALVRDRAKRYVIRPAALTISQLHDCLHRLIDRFLVRPLHVVDP